MRIRRFAQLLPFSWLLLFSYLLAHAQGTQFWSQSSYESFERGAPQGVAIRSDGSLLASAAAEEWLTTPSSSIWSMVADAQGNLYLGTGSPATVLRITSDGKSTKLLETSDVSVQAVRLGPDGMLYAATLPHGKVYRIDPHAASQSDPQSATVVFDSSSVSAKPAYIWDLAFDHAGRLYIATGAPAAIYRIHPKQPASPEPFFTSSEEHIRTLLMSQDGTLYAGTDGRGLVYRIAPDGKGFVLFEAPRREIPAMAIDPEGHLYIAALGEKSRTTLPPLSVHSEPTLTATVRIVVAGATENNTDSTLVPNGSVIYQLASDGTPRELWSSTHDVVYTLAWQKPEGSAPGGLLAGSGNLGHLYRIDPDGAYADLAHLEARQTTALAFSGHTLYAATSNLGKIYRLSFTASKTPSTYISEVHDAQFLSQWGRPQVRATGSYDLLARVGNIEQPGEGWSDWLPVSTDASPATLPKARYLQWKAVLHPGTQVNEVGFYYLPQNVAPVVDAVVVAMHTRVTPGLNPETQNNPVAINLPSPNEGATYQVESTTPLMAAREHGWATVRWGAHDDNGDALRYSVYYRGQGEQNWHPLARNIATTYLSFDLTRLPDDGYTLRVVASDAPSHPAGEALTGYQDSSYFLLDTTSPVLSALQATQKNAALHITFDAAAKLSTIARAYVSLDAGPWQYVEPAGRLSDALTEHYDLTLPLPPTVPATPLTPAPGQHVIAVRVIDRAGNSATSKAVVP